MASTLAAPRAARALWAGPGAQRALSAGGRGEVEFALHPGGYTRLGDAWLLIATPRAPRGPLTLVVAGLDAAPLVAGDDVVVEGRQAGAPPAPDEEDTPRPAAPRFADDDVALETTPRAAAPPLAGEGVLRAGALRIELAGLQSVHLAAPPPLGPGWRAALAAALAAAPPAPRELAPGLTALRRDDLATGVAELAGRGEGLTPAGDDVLAGFAAWRHAEGRPIALATRPVPVLAGERCSPLGLAYLRCAERGELPGAVDDVLRAIRAGDRGAARRRAGGLSRWGSSSGAAMLWGIAAGACS